MTPLAHPNAWKAATKVARSRRGVGLAVVMGVFACILAALALPAIAQAQRAPVAAPSPRPEDGVRWQNLTPAQREVLAPLEREWPGIDAPRKQKWIVIAGHYRTLPPQERARITERMTEWAKLTPVERGEVRLRYQEARQVPALDRQARWQAYQKLPASEKQQFAAKAASAVAPPLTDPAQRDLASGTKSGKVTLSQAKANVVPNPALTLPPRPVTPTVVQAAPGVTTRLITRPATPPAHQQTGMPKIAATPEFVNRSTLLPRRGPQAAAVVPTPTTPAMPAPPARIPPPGPTVTAKPSSGALPP
jgi:hypothetical protein